MIEFSNMTIEEYFSLNGQLTEHKVRELMDDLKDLQKALSECSDLAEKAFEIADAAVSSDNIDRKTHSELQDVLEKIVLIKEKLNED